MINKLIEKKLLEKNYGIITPATQSFGGFYLSLLWGIRKVRFKNLKPLICISFINKHGDYNSFLNPYGKKILLNVLINLPLKQLLFSIIITIIYNFYSLVLKLKINIFFKEYLKINIDKYIIYSLGYNYPFHKDSEEYLTIDNFKDLKSIDIEVSDFIPKVQKIEDLHKDYNIVCLFIKDKGFNKIKPITNYNSADIKKTIPALNLLLDKKYCVIRVGEKTAHTFNYNNNNYFDFTKKKNSNSILNNTYSKCDFYFGTSGSTSDIAEVFDKRKYIINSLEFLRNETSFDYKNVAIFKKIFSLKEKRLLSIEEIFEKKIFLNYTHENEKNDDLILIENTEFEIIEGMKLFLKNQKSSFTKSKLLLDYEEIRKKFISLLDNEDSDYSIKYYYNSVVTIPDDYLEKFLFHSQLLDEESKLIAKKLDMGI